MTLPPSLDIFHPASQPNASSSSSSFASPASPADTVVPEMPVPIDITSLPSPTTRPSVLTEMIRSPPDYSNSDRDHRGSNASRQESSDGSGTSRATPTLAADVQEVPVSERTSLLPRSSQSKTLRSYGVAEDVEMQGVAVKQRPNAFHNALSNATFFIRVLSNPKTWDRRTLWERGIVEPVSLLPSVFLGLLLNILDALSYGMILFPLGEPIFSELGSDGISMFYVSTIIAQLVFSCGGSIFRGGIGSEMIEVVPFFHQMAFTILARVGPDNPKSVLATCILAFSVSSVLTGIVFFLMGTCGLGSLIGFFPRHILIGCIGGVGFFLMQTGVEVSARLPGSLEYTLPTLQRLFQLDTVFLWITPVVLAVGLLVLKRFVRSNFLVGGYFIGVAVIFYIVKLSARVPMDALRDSGWVFDAPSSSNPWWHFYTLYGESTYTDFELSNF